MITQRQIQLISLLVLSGLTSILAQPLGISQLPQDLTKTTLLIEQYQIKDVDDFLPVGTAPSKIFAGKFRGTRLDSNLYIKARSPRELYEPIGSGVLISHDSILFLVTAAHVAEVDSNLFFRILQKKSNVPDHRSYQSIRAQTGLGWIIRKQYDLAIMPFLCTEKDSILFIDIDTYRADYDSVSLGDGIFVLGYPSSVVFTPDPTVHFVRDGIISSKLPEGKLIIDALLFPGNSGGPVFWKPARALIFGTGLTGKNIPGREAKLVGIVSQTLQYREEALSTSTGRTRVTFEENSGLAIVISASRIMELLNDPAVQTYIKSQ